MALLKKITFLLFTLLLIGFLLPQNLKMPVKGATKKDYNQESFWYYPWGKSITHKGVDVFAKKGNDVLAATNGIVLFAGEIGMGGNFILMLGPKWRLHYYAHLNTIETKRFKWHKSGAAIATVGDSGNAKGKPPHLHYSIVTPIPYLWRIDNSKQGWKKMFYLNPIKYLNKK